MKPGADDNSSLEGTEVNPSQRLSNVFQMQRLKKNVARRAAREALALGDAVHVVAGLPSLPLTCTTDASQVSSEFRRPINLVTGQVEYPSIILFVSDPEPGSLRLVASLLHEIGHAIDLLALGNRQPIFCSETHAQWNDWRKAVMCSEHVMEVTRLASCPPYRPGIEPPEPDYLFQATAWRNRQFNELWARSYAQFIAVRNDHAELLATLRGIRDPPDDNYPDHFVPRQWSDGDFAPIQDSIDQLFGRLGWHRS